MRAPILIATLTVALAVGCGISFREGGGGGSSPVGGGGTGATGADSPATTGGGPTTGGMGGTSAGEPLGGSGGDGGEGGRVPMVCPANTAGRPLVFIDAPGGAFCIDETEVTVGDYEAFVAAATPGQNAGDCSWNSDYVPAIGSNDCTAEDYDTSAPDNAISCIDWCDARDYCAWAGKRLCGKIGGGPNALEDFADPTQDEWMYACSAGGTTMFPYGDTYSPTTCIGDDFDGVDDGPMDHPQSVTSAPGCEGGFTGVFGMSGHVWEWTNACAANAGDPAQTRCRLRGGSFWDNPGSLECASPDFSHFVRGYFNKNHGVRCCADPVMAR